MWDVVDLFSVISSSLLHSEQVFFFYLFCTLCKYLYIVVSQIKIDSCIICQVKTFQTLVVSLLKNSLNVVRMEYILPVIGHVSYAHEQWVSYVHSFCPIGSSKRRGDQKGMWAHVSAQSIVLPFHLRLCHSLSKWKQLPRKERRKVGMCHILSLLCHSYCLSFCNWTMFNGCN